MEGLDAAGHPGLPGDRGQQGSAYIHAGAGFDLRLPVLNGLRPFLLHLEDWGHGPCQIFQSDIPAELSDRNPLPDDEPALPILQFYTSRLLLVHSGKFLCRFCFKCRDVFFFHWFCSLMKVDQRNSVNSYIWITYE